MYRTLDAERLAETILRLHQRISQRFPGSSLSRVGAELHEISLHARVRAERIQRTNLLLRTASLLMVAGIFTALIVILLKVRFAAQVLDLPELTQFMESALGTLVFIGAAVLFCITIENRVKRRRALDAIYELRVLAHIVDMHQLTKDPEHVFREGDPTASSSQGTLTAFELNRYLDYCTELLSLISKVGVLYVQRLHDSAVLDAVDQLEDLTTGLSEKIWAKINILDRERRRHDAP